MPNIHELKHKIEKYIKEKLVTVFFEKISDKRLFESVLSRSTILEKAKDFVSISVDTRGKGVSKVVMDLMKSCRVIDLEVKEPELKDIIAEIYKHGVKR